MGVDRTSASRGQTDSTWLRLSQHIKKAARARGPWPFPTDQPAEILERLRSLGVLHDLQDRQAMAVAEFVRDVTLWTEHTPKKEWLRTFRSSNQHLRKLNRKVDKLRKAFKGLTEYWTAIGGKSLEVWPWDEPEPKGNVLLVNDLDEDYGVTAILDSIAIAIQQLDPIPTHVALAKQESSQQITLKTAVVVALNDLFVTDCRLSNNESEIRIAKVGNHLWKWKFDYRERSEGAELWRGCEAVRKILKRYVDRQQGTSGKKSRRKS